MNPKLPFNREALGSDDGISLFSAEDFYWESNISRAQIQQVAEHLKSGQTIDRACGSAGVPLDYIAEYQRSDWIYFLPIPQVSGRRLRVLDLGAGFGNITIPLAKHLPNADIYAVDAALDILRVLKERAHHEGCANIIPAKVGIFEALDLPFFEKSFDLILMNGVLEWIGAGTKEGSPRQHQQRFLAYVRTLLADEGSLYIGIEGRYFPGYFMRIPDPHSKLMFTSVVPRPLADILCRRAGLPGYRTYIHSHAGYLKLLTEAGYAAESIETLYPIASYKDPYFVFSYRDGEAYRYAFRRLAARMFPGFRGRMLYTFLYLIGAEKFFAPSYLFIVRRTVDTKPSPRLLSHALGTSAESAGTEPLKILGNRSDEGSAPFLLIDRKSGLPTHMLKIKRIPDTSGAWSRKWEYLSRQHSAHTVQPSTFSDRIALFPFVEGKNPGSSSPDLRRAIELIHAWHIETKTARETLGSVSLSRGATHGDYTIENIIISKDGWKIIDWEDWGASDWQVFDACSLLLHAWLIDLRRSPSQIASLMLSEDTLSHLRVCEKDLDAASMRVVWEAFLKRTAERWSKRRVSRAALYLSVYDALKKSPGRIAG